MDESNPAMRDLFMGGEDEEAQDLEPGQPAAGRRPAYLDIDIRSNPDGSATVRYLTNDRDGDGRPDREASNWEEILVGWEESHASVAEAQRMTGRSRREPGGRTVSVYLEGKRLT